MSEADEFFGRDDPQTMPPWLFGCFGQGGVQLHYESAERADITKQHYSVCPRYWYVDATMRCAACDQTFLFSAAEQRRWYEDFRFYIQSLPRHCPACRQNRRQLKSLRQEYDRCIGSALETADPNLKSRTVAVIDELCESGEPLQVKVHENRKILALQIARANNDPRP